MNQEVIVRYTQIVKQHKNFRNLANQDWVTAQSKDHCHSPCYQMDATAEERSQQA